MQRAAERAEGNVRDVTRRQSLVDALRADIAAGKFLPGDRVTETALANAYGTSRTPVREALRVLTQEMLLVYSPNWGYRVSGLQLSDLDDLYAVRIGLECQSVVQLAQGSGQIGEVRSLLRIWDVEPSAIRVDVNLVFADEAFHETLAAASGGTVLLPMLKLINRRLHSSRMREFIDTTRVQRTYEQHAAILRAVLEQDPSLATALMQAHILEGKRYVRAAVLALEQESSGRNRLDPARRVED